MALTLHKQTENFVLDQGATFIKTFTAKNTAGGNVVISSGTTAAKLRQSIDSSNNIHTFSTSVSGSNVTISMTATNTASISEDRRYVYDIEFTQSDTTTVEKIVEGNVTISPHAGDREFPDIITESIAGNTAVSGTPSGQWGNTYWTDFVRNDGNKDRAVTWKGGDSNDHEWGDSGEDRWYEMEGPHHDDLDEMKAVVVAEGTYTSHRAWDEALMRLVEYPNTYNSDTDTWSTGSYAALSDGEARSGKPFTVCSVFSSPFNPLTDADYDMDNQGTVWSTAPYHSSRSRGGGWRLQQIHGRLKFQIGHWNRNQDNYNRVDGYLKIVHGRSANTTLSETDPSGCYQDPFENANNSTTVYQTMNPNEVDGDIRMWYQITCVYNGGPVGYWKPNTRSETEAELIQNIKDSFKFYQTNLWTGKVQEIEWHHIQASNQQSNYLGFVQGVGYRGDHQDTGAGSTFFGAFCDGADSSFIFKSNWAGTWVTNTALSQSDLQGNIDREEGFALDPLGWATENDKDATNTWIWSPSHHPNRAVNVDKSNYSNITSGASDSNDLRALSNMKDKEYFYTQDDTEFWANNYPLDTR